MCHWSIKHSFLSIHTKELAQMMWIPLFSVPLLPSSPSRSPTCFIFLCGQLRFPMTGTVQLSVLYSKSDREDASNYRPARLTSIVCKIMESILKTSMMNHVWSRQQPYLMPSMALFLVAPVLPIFFEPNNGSRSPWAMVNRPT